MSKNKKKDANAKTDVPIDYQVESKNLQYTITLKDNEIDMLQKENQKKKQYILELEEEIKRLKKDYIKAYELENTIKANHKKIEHQEKEIDNLNNKIKEQKKKNEEEKKQIEQNFQDEIHQLKVVIESSSQKVEMANQLSNENEELIKEVDQLKIEQKNIIDKHIAENKQRDIKNQIKFSNLKNKMKEKIDKVKNEFYNKTQEIFNKIEIIGNPNSSCILIKCEDIDGLIHKLKKNGFYVCKQCHLKEDWCQNKFIKVNLGTWFTSEKIELFVESIK